MYFRKPSIRTNKLHVQETDLGLTQFNRSRAYLSSRMDGIPALDLRDLVIEVFHSSPKQSKKTKDQARGDSSRNTTSNKHTQNRTKVPTKHNNLESSDVDYVSSNAKSSLFAAMIYIFVDSDAVTNMIIKNRSPTTRTYGVSLDWLFDRINLDPKIQIRFIDTKHQLADILTTVHFTRAEWNNLLHLFNISHFTSTCCAKNSSLISCPSRTRRNSRPDEAQSSQVKLIHVYLAGLMDQSVVKFVATEENQVLWKFSESESWSIHEDEVTRKSVADKKGAVKPAASSKERK